ncbi:MAG: hypothetical protein LBT44_03070 [Clostridiales bacterium]|jgi:hypothetical protein|nr:hypothetical protein [Clostridiales bacterium]
MDWDKAKNLTILFLVLLNLFLGAFVYTSRNRFTLDARQLKAIEDLLDRNSIHYQEAMIPKSYAPKRPLLMSKYEYDDEELLNRFFLHPEEARRFDEPDNKTEYICQDQVLTLQNGYISFDNPKGTGPMDSFDEAAAVRACENFLPSLGREIAQFKLDGVDWASGENGFRVQYCQVYERNILYTNFVTFLVTEMGITQIDCQYSAPLGFSGKPVEICSSDEALLNFTQQLRSATDQEAVITRVDLVYYQAEGSGTSSKATPYYRIMVEHLDAPFLINAYINTG